MTTTAAYEVAEAWGRVLPFPGYELDLPQLWECHNGEWVEYPHIMRDVYDLLRSYFDLHRTTTQPTPSAFALMTSGYAAPIIDGEPMGQPSEHPNKLRVALCVVYDRDGSQSSCLRFQGEEKEDVTTNGGEESGTLAAALDAVAVVLWGAEWITRYALGGDVAGGLAGELDGARLDRVASARQLLADMNEGDNEQ